MFSRDFLAQMARDHELSREQEDVFLLRLADGKSYQEIASQLKTSPDACLKRMGQIYNKFKVSGSSRGKENRLRSFLINQLQRVTEKSPEATKPVLADEVPQAATDNSEAIGGQPLFGRTSSTRIYENLPNRDCTAFIGRQTEIARLLELLSFDHSAHLISVDGIGGVGKTTLVLEAAYRCLQASRGVLTEHNSDLLSRTNDDKPSPTKADLNVPIFEAIIFTSAKQHYLTAAGLLPRLKREHTLRDIFRAIANTLDRSEITYMPAEEQLDLIRDSLVRRRSLLIVDNLETIEDKQDVLGFVYDLPPTVKVILTTREQALFVPIRLESLPEADGLCLINHEAQEKGVTLSKEEAKALYQKTSGVPAAIVYTIGQLAAGYLLQDVLVKVTNAKGDVARFCFESSVQRLKGLPSHRLLMTLALFPKPVLRETIAQIALSVPDPIITADGLAQLQQLSLVRQWQGRYSLLPLTREYAMAELTIEPQIEQEVRSRWINWYLRFSEEYGAKDWKEWHLEYTHLELEWENVQAVLEWCAAKERYVNVLALWRQIKGYAHVRGYWDDRLDWTDWLIQAAEQRTDWSTAAEVMYDRGWTLTLMGQPKCLDEASILLQRAWGLKDYKDLSFRLELVTSMVVLCIRQQQFDQAHQWLSQKQTMLEQAGLEEGERHRQWIHSLYYEAEIYFKAGDYAQAKTLYQQALEQAIAAGWQRAINAIQNWLADVAIEQGNLEEAQHLLEQGLPVAERNKDKRSIAFHHRSFAILEQLRGHQSQAQRWAKEAAEGFESLRMIPQAREMRDLLRGQ
ncbi:MAG TPA: RNA polymerase subunit sigma-24 [Cyanobacteria bacterium UBA8543]|nr:RNA polymerase subunit sigma-24 [Cyanobacteria bacterium UBA8543]